MAERSHLESRRHHFGGEGIESVNGVSPTCPPSVPSHNSETPFSANPNESSTEVKKLPEADDPTESKTEVEKLEARVAELELELKKEKEQSASKPGAMQRIGSAGSQKATSGFTARTTFVLFGADGNLATKKTFPTLFALWRKKLLPKSILIVGFAREAMKEEHFRRMVYKAIYSSAHTNAERMSFLERCHYVYGQFDDTEHYAQRLKPKLEALEDERDKSLLEASADTLKGIRSQHEENYASDTNEAFDQLAATAATSSPRIAGGPAAAHTRQSSAQKIFSHNDADHPHNAMQPWGRSALPWEDPDHDETRPLRIYYLAVPPFLYASICGALRQSGARADDDEAMAPLSRYVLEKPFGQDLASCRALCAALAEVVRENETYRIDHYLGKELVMNVLVLRFANVCFEAIWSRFHIARVEVCCFEEIGTEGRGGYFDQYGIIRDVLQNHLAQILALVAMEQPLSFGADDIRREKVKVLRSVRPLDADRDLVIGQFDGYLDDDTIIDKGSKTETFAAARLYIDNPRWAGVPFILTAGKALSQKKVEVKITFQNVAGPVQDCRGLDPNELVVRVQPDAGIYWRVQNRVPGLHSKLKIEARRMNLLYTPTESRHMPEAYERLLLEVIRGDATNFVSVDELDAAWTIFTPALDNLALREAHPERYPFGSDGPSVQRLIDPNYRHKHRNSGSNYLPKNASFDSQYSAFHYDANPRRSPYPSQDEDDLVPILAASNGHTSSNSRPSRTNVSDTKLASLTPKQPLSPRPPSEAHESTYLSRR